MRSNQCSATSLKTQTDYTRIYCTGRVEIVDRVDPGSHCFMITICRLEAESPPVHFWTFNTEGVVVLESSCCEQAVHKRGGTWWSCHKHVKENVRMAQNLHAVITYVIWPSGALLDFLIEWFHIVLPNVSSPHLHFNKSCCSFVFIFRDTSSNRTLCWNTSTVRLPFSAALTCRERLRWQTSSRKSFGYLFWVVNFHNRYCMIGSCVASSASSFKV